MPASVALDSDSVLVFVLAAFLGLQLIKRVSTLLHSPLMSLTNAIAAVSVIGAITILGDPGNGWLARTLGFIAVTAATTNLVSGFLITDRMLKMFRKPGDRP
jgi:NAD(P) transhydrogenase subunit alpha